MKMLTFQELAKSNANGNADVSGAAKPNADKNIDFSRLARPNADGTSMCEFPRPIKKLLRIYFCLRSGA